MKILNIKILLFLTLFSILESASTSSNLNKQNSDAFKTLEEIANENNQAVEQQEVTTTDGYILNLYRIPGHLREEPTTAKPVVLLQHGIMTDMMCWVMNTPDVAPAFVLAKEGQDVWLGNNRGTRFSQTHVSLDPKEKSYWEFTWEQMGIYDVPSFIEFIQEKTGKSKITQIGHSEGSAQLLAGASLMPDWQKEKLNLAVLLAPVSTMYQNDVEVMKLLMQSRNFLLDILDSIKLWNILPQNQVDSEPTTLLCKAVPFICNEFLHIFTDMNPQLDNQDRQPELTSNLPSGSSIQNQVDSEPTTLLCKAVPFICNEFLHIFTDMNPQLDNQDRQPELTSNLPSGSSIQNQIHFGQQIVNKVQDFRRFDQENKLINQQKQQQDAPPSYNLESIDFPLAILQGSEDQLADPKDVQWLMSKVSKAQVFEKQYTLGHMSFLIGKDMSFFTIDTLGLVNKYNKKMTNENINQDSNLNMII